MFLTESCSEINGKQYYRTSYFALELEQARFLRVTSRVTYFELELVSGSEIGRLELYELLNFFELYSSLLEPLLLKSLRA